MVFDESIFKEYVHEYYVDDCTYFFILHCIWEFTTNIHKGNRT